MVPWRQTSHERSHNGHIVHAESEPTLTRHTAEIPQGSRPYGIVEITRFGPRLNDFNVVVSLPLRFPVRGGASVVAAAHGKIAIEQADGHLKANISEEDFPLLLSKRTSERMAELIQQAHTGYSEAAAEVATTEGAVPDKRSVEPYTISYGLTLAENADIALALLLLATGHQPG